MRFAETMEKLFVLINNIEQLNHVADNMFDFISLNTSMNIHECNITSLVIYFSIYLFLLITVFDF